MHGKVRAKATHPKKMEPVARSTAGVTRAATPQPKNLKMRCPTSIITSVVAPVAEENCPMNSE